MSIVESLCNNNFVFHTLVVDMLVQEIYEGQGFFGTIFYWTSCIVGRVALHHVLFLSVFGVQKLVYQLSQLWSWFSKRYHKNVLVFHYAQPAISVIKAVLWNLAPPKNENFRGALLCFSVFLSFGSTWVFCMSSGVQQWNKQICYRVWTFRTLPDTEILCATAAEDCVGMGKEKWSLNYNWICFAAITC